MSNRISTFCTFIHVPFSHCFFNAGPRGRTGYDLRWVTLPHSVFKINKLKNNLGMIYDVSVVQSALIKYYYQTIDSKIHVKVHKSDN